MKKLLIAGVFGVMLASQAYAVTQDTEILNKVGKLYDTLGGAERCAELYGTFDRHELRALSKHLANQAGMLMANVTIPKDKWRGLFDNLQEVVTRANIERNWTLKTCANMYKVLVSVFASQSTATERNAVRQEFKEAQDNWYQCLEDFTRRMAAKTKEPADVIIRAAFVDCHQSGEINSFFAWAKLPTEEQRLINRDLVRKGFADDLLVVVPKERAK